LAWVFQTRDRKKERIGPSRFAEKNKEFSQVPVPTRKFLTPVAGLFLWALGFENIFKTQGIFKIQKRFRVMLE